MPVFLSGLIQSGNKHYRHLTASTERELDDMAHRLHERTHGKGCQAPHLDLNLRKAALALQFGAQEIGECNAGIHRPSR